MKKKKRIGRRRKGILWDYNYDGMYGERYTAFDKRYWRRWRRRNGKQEVTDFFAGC
jgi:hypothetical protein